MNIDANQFAEVIRFLLGCAALYAVWRLMIVRTLNDEFRQRVFEYRRELFMLAMDGKIDFEDPAYARARKAMNGLLRHAEHFSFTRLIAAFVAGVLKSAKAKAEGAVDPDDNLPKAVRDKLDDLLSLSFIAAVKRAVVVSPVALVVVAIVLGVLRVRKLFRSSAPAGRRALVQMFPKRHLLSEAAALDGADPIPA